MSSDIVTAPLEELCEAVFDCPHSTPAWTDQGVVVLRSSNIRNGRLDLSSPSFTDEFHYEERSRRARIKAGDLVITREAPMGEVCLIPDNLRCCLGQRMVMLRPDQNQCHGQYLLYALQSKRVQDQIQSHEGTGTTVSNLRIPVLKQLLIPSPGIDTQKAIAHILGTLDDKIELNRKTNETLEAMAKALFKSWFVDFDPVRAKAEGRPTGLPAEISDLFPDSFEDSELGEIPSGWEIKKIGEIISRLPVGKRFDQKTVSPKGSIPVLDQSTSGIVGYHDEEAGVLVTKNFPLFTFANHTCAMRYMIRPFSVIQNVFPLRGNGVNTAWLYQASQGKQEITEYKGHYPDFIDKQVVVPANGIDKIYGGDCERILIKCDFNLINSAFLASIRDALLPKLISGEIRIPDAEKMLEEVGI